MSNPELPLDVEGEPQVEGWSHAVLADGSQDLSQTHRGRGRQDVIGAPAPTGALRRKDA